MKIQAVMIKAFCLMIVVSTGYSQNKDEKEEFVLHFGYGSNMSESYMLQYTPSLEYVMNAQLPNFE
ncbi:uncharacterized protein METZ01_LOCUS238077, partial [marine metagenome]